MPYRRIRYMNSETVAEYMDLGTGKKGAALVRQLVHRREIPFIKIGSRLRFDRLEIDRLMTEHTTQIRRSLAWLSVGNFIAYLF